MARDYRNLEAFRVADELVIRVYASTQAFPREELFGLTSQIRRASVSGATNIVEGSAKSSDRDFARFLEISLGSLRETAYQLTIAKRLGYLNEDQSAELEEKCDHAARLVARLIGSLDRL